MLFIYILYACSQYAVDISKIQYKIVLFKFELGCLVNLLIFNNILCDLLPMFNESVIISNVQSIYTKFVFLKTYFVIRTRVNGIRRGRCPFR